MEPHSGLTGPRPTTEEIGPAGMSPPPRISSRPGNACREARGEVFCSSRVPPGSNAIFQPVQNGGFLAYTGIIGLR